MQMGESQKKSGFHTIRNRVTGWLCGLFAFLALIIAVFFVWVMAGPRSINFFTPYIESALSSPATGYKVKIENSDIEWNSWHNPFGMSIRNVAVINDKGATLAYFPEVQVKIYLYKLLWGAFEIKSMALIGPNIMLVQNEDGSIALGLNNNAGDETTSSISAILTLLTSEGSENPVRHMRLLLIKHAILSVKNKTLGVFLRSSDTSVGITRKHGRIKGDFIMPVTFENKSGELSGNFSIDKPANLIVAQLFFKSIATSALHILFPKAEWLNGANFSVSGAVRVFSDMAANLNAADFRLEAKQGELKYPNLFTEPVHIQNITIGGNVADQMNTLNISNAKITLGREAKPINLLLKGVIKKAGADYAVDGHGETANVSADDLRHYWPIPLSPHSRAWVTTHITAGTVTKADVDLHFKPGEMNLGDTPENAVSSNIAVRNVSIKYLPGHPEITDAAGVIKFTGRSMDARVQSAKFMTGTQITSASVRLPDMYPDDVRMFIDLDADAPAKDISAFLALPKVEKAQQLGLNDTITGRVTGNAKLNFIAFSMHDDDKTKEGGDFNYAISASLQNVSQQKFLGNRDIENANMKITVNNKGIKAVGNAAVNKVSMAVDLSSSFAKGHETDYAIRCDMPVKSLPDFGLPALDFAHGTIGVNSKFIESDTASHSESVLDLMNTDINLPQHGFIKKAGDKAALSLTTDKLPDGNTAIKPFLLAGSNMLLSGNAEFNKASNDISEVTFNPLRYGNDDLVSLEYKELPTGIQLSANGNSFDISPYVKSDKVSGKTKGYALDIKVKRLVFGEKREMQDVMLEADCGSSVCRSAHVSARLDDNGTFNYTIKDGKLSAASDNAGELFRVLGVIGNIQGGKMTLTGSYNGDKIEGALVMRDYTLRKAPLLTKMLTIASLTGFVDTLTGNGIAFSRLYAPFTWRDGLIVLKDAKTHGPALGLTAGGDIELANSTLDLNGALVPSYTLNSLIGNVPLIGDLLVGGKGKGILAINYAIKGNMDDPSVTVNPLSALTPGFLRNIFDIFDQPAPDIDKISAQHKKAAEDRENERKAKEQEEKEKQQKKRDPNLPSIELLKME